MRPLAADEEMKRKRGPKNDSSHTETFLDNGTPNSSGRNFGTCLTAVKIPVKAFVSFRLATGQRWTYGSISHRKILIFLKSIFPTNGVSLTDAEYGLQILSLLTDKVTKRLLRELYGSEP